MNRAFVFFMVGALTGLMLLSGSAAQAVALSPELHQRMEAAGPDGKVPVIVRFATRTDLRAFAQRHDRSGARAEMVRGLRNQARRSQGPLQGFLRRQGMEPSELWLINALAVRVPPALVEILSAWPDVAAIELDGQVPSPPAPVTLALLAAPHSTIALLGVQTLWDAGFTGTGVVVASFDTGVDVTHPDLAGRWRGGSNSWFDPYTNSTEPYDSGEGDGHGSDFADGRRCCQREFNRCRPRRPVDRRQDFSRRWGC